MTLNSKTLAVIAITILLVAMLPIPAYGYYTFTRITIFLIAIYFAVKAHGQENTNQLLFAVGVAILYNPIIPIHLTKLIWVVLNLLTAVMFYKEFYQKLDNT